MIKFEIVKGYENKHVNLPTRKTAASAGYDFEVAEDIIVPSYWDSMVHLTDAYPEYELKYVTLNEVASATKSTKLKPTLVPTGIKCQMKDNMYLQLSVRSSCPLKNWLILANGVGIIDSDYYGNPDNDGHIYFQIINLSPWDIQLKKGDVIGQGVLLPYFKTNDDAATEERLGGFGSTDNGK